MLEIEGNDVIPGWFNCLFILIEFVHESFQNVVISGHKSLCCLARDCHLFVLM